SGRGARATAAIGAAADPTALASGAPAVRAAARGAAAAAAASGPWGAPRRLRGSRPRPTAARQQPAGSVPPARELIQPSVASHPGQCTVRGCGKILPSSPALHMHPVKSHRLQLICNSHHSPSDHPLTDY
ncbi:ATM interactor-like, partial [Bos javanicus]|uniref:ATM interactor-like n=1 Tax=Bos javanicus TaxID=9906 RepID=UPI002AA6DC5B